MNALPLTRDLVLIGGGHAHALVLRRWAMNPLPGVRLTLISPGPTAPYSGMLPGFVAGHYPRAALDIDLIRLARFAGARLVLGTVTGLSPKARRIQITGQAPVDHVDYDVASVNIGITSEMPDLPGFAAHGVPVKPLGPFADRWDALRRGDSPPDIAVIGAGVAGAELAMAMAHALRGRGAQVHLIDRGAALAELPGAPRDKLRRALAQTGVLLHEQAPVAEISSHGVHLKTGDCIAAGFVTGAAGARPQAWLAETGLETHEGYLSVGPTLQTSDPSLFAAGDCAHLRHAPRPKAGVFAVREAPVLAANLRAALRGTRMQRYRPQRDYLKLVSLGGKNAMALRFGRAPSGGWVWRWKDHIDRRFMEKFRALPAMEPPQPRQVALGVQEALGDKPMCAGCGAKVGPGALSQALAQLPPTPRPDVESLPGDDAAILRIGGQRQVISTDHLRAVTEDPVLMARIAATHALGDIWAMGATPQAALLSVILPRMDARLQARTMQAILSAAEQELTRAGAALIGGHSSMGTELTLGFTVTGLVDQPITLAGAQASDALILTKPLGSGTILAAEMALAAPPEAVRHCWGWMVQPQGTAADILRAEARAMTDVTGFGLAGHLNAIANASGLGAQIRLADLPLMEGAETLAAAGIRSSLHGDNLAASGVVIDPGGPRAALVHDPQTAGGLLAAVPAAKAGALTDQLRAAGYPAAVIGQMIEGSGVALL